MRFTGGDNLTGLEKKVHEALIKTELVEGMGAYEVSYAGGDSGLTFGGNQMDLATGDKKYRDLFDRILKEATNKNGERILKDGEIEKIQANYRQIGIKPEQAFGNLVHKVNAALSSEFGMEEINAIYPIVLQEKIANVRKGISLITNEENKKILSSDAWIVRLVDYDNKFYLSLNKNKDGSFPQNSILKFLNGEEVILKNYARDKDGKKIIDSDGNYVIKNINKVTIDGKLDIEDFENYIRATDDYNKTENAKRGLDNRLSKLEKAVYEHGQLHVAKGITFDTVSKGNTDLINHKYDANNKAHHIEVGDMVDNGVTAATGCNKYSVATGVNVDLKLLKSAQLEARYDDYALIKVNEKLVFHSKGGTEFKILENNMLAVGTGEIVNCDTYDNHISKIDIIPHLKDGGNNICMEYIVGGRGEGYFILDLMQTDETIHTEL